MHWMQWVREKSLNIYITTPLCRVRAGKKKLTGWLIGKNGCLEAIYSFIASKCEALFTALSWQNRPGATTFAGGLRPCGAARLTGVLHYFTRGPDGIF